MQVHRREANNMSTINLKLEQIKEEDFIIDKHTNDENTDIKYSTVAQCGRIFIDLEVNEVNVSCYFCDANFKEVYNLIEHFRDIHIIASNEHQEDFNDLDTSLNENSLEIAPVNFTKDAEEFEEPEEHFEESIDIETDIASSPPYECEICDKVFRSKFKLKNHIAIHSGILRYKCKDCSKAFQSEELLRYHSALHTGEDYNYKCNHCDQIFVHRRYLQMHLNYHFADISFPCTICGKVNRTSHQLKVHMLKHSTKKDHICEICGSSYRLRHHLINHQKQTHENKRDYKCNKCDRAFNTLSFLKNHQVSHSKERNHVCGTCGAAFMWRKNLVEHLKLHSSIKNYKCQLCSKTFSQKSGLSTHLKSHMTLKKSNSNDLEKP